MFTVAFKGTEGGYEISNFEGIDINTAEDFEKASKIFKFTK